VAPGAGDLDVRGDGDVGPRGEVAIDRVGALLAVAGGLDEGRRTGHEVAAGKDAADVRRVRRGIDLDAPAVDLEVGLDRQEREVRGLRHRGDHDVGLDAELRAFDRDWRAPAGGVRLAEP